MMPTRHEWETRRREGEGEGEEMGREPILRPALTRQNQWSGTLLRDLRGIGRSLGKIFEYVSLALQMRWNKSGLIPSSPSSETKKNILSSWKGLEMRDSDAFQLFFR